MPYDNFNPVLNGLITGYGLADQIRRSALEQEREKRLRSEMEQEGQLQDMTILERMARAGRPVQGGMVNEVTDLPGFSTEFRDPVSGLALAGAPMPGFRNEVLRKVDASRHVKYKDRSGQMHEAELYTPDEQLQRDIKGKVSEQDALHGGQLRNLSEELLMRGRASTTNAVEQRSGLLERFGMDVDPDGPGGQDPVRVMPSEADSLIQAFTRQNPPPKEPKAVTVQSTRVTVDDDGNQTQVLTYSDGTTEEMPLKAKGKKTKPTAPKEPKPDPAIAARKKQIDDLQKKIDEIETQKAAIAAENQQIGSTTGKAKDREGKILTNKAKYHGLVAQQQAYQKIKEGLYGGAGQPSAPQQQAGGASQYAVGQTVKLKDGKQVTIKKLNPDGTFEY